MTEFLFRVDRVEYLGSERIVYGQIEGHGTEHEVMAKLPLAHVPLDSIRPGEWHAFAVRNNAVCHFNHDGKRMRRH